MRRWTVRILVCLFLGAIINVAVAWGIASSVSGIDVDDAELLTYWGHGESAFNVYRKRTACTTIVWLISEMDHTPETLSEFREYWSHEPQFVAADDFPFDAWSVPGQIRAGQGNDAPGGINAFLTYDIAQGWPFRTLFYRMARVEPTPSPWLVTGGLQLSDGTHFDSPTVLPTSPTWPGFLANTGLYAGVAWALFFFTPAQIRRRIRRTRGHCPSCGYDLQGNAGGASGGGGDSGGGCPECGWGREAGAAT